MWNVMCLCVCTWPSTSSLQHSASHVSIYTLKHKKENNIWHIRADVLVDLMHEPGCLWLSHTTGRRSSPPCWPAPVWGSGSHSGEAPSGRWAAPPDVHTWTHRHKNTKDVRVGGIISFNKEPHAGISRKQTLKASDHMAPDPTDDSLWQD